MSSKKENLGLEITPEYISSIIKKFDKDVAARFILSGLSLNKKKVIEALILASDEMAIRKTAQSNSTSKEFSKQHSYSQEELDKMFDDLMKLASTPIKKTDK